MQSTFTAFPNTLLGNSRRMEAYYNSNSQEYVFDRDPDCFEEIFGYYQSGGKSLSKPNDVVLIDFLREIIFFDLGPSAVDQVLTQHKSFRLLASVQPVSEFMFKSYFWDLLEHPSSGKVAKSYAIVRIILMVTIALLATISSSKYNASLGISGYDEWVASPLFIVQAGLLFLITIDFLLRLVFCPHWKRFFKSPFNLIDAANSFFLTVFCLTLILTVSSGGHTESIDKHIVNIFLLCEILQLYKVYKHNSLLRAVTSTVVSKSGEILSVFIIIILAAGVFGYAFYVVEYESREEDGSLLTAVMWALVTMTTVGYGNVVPKTSLGRLVAWACILASRVLFSMLIPIFGEAYQQYVNGIKSAQQFNILVTKKENKIECLSRGSTTTSENILDDVTEVLSEDGSTYNDDKA
ncbi:hypothetical protein ACOME3_001600 [Neoechinorhynchus agilis]